MARMVSPGYHSVRSKPSGKYEARWGDENGNLKSKSFLTERQADAWAMKKALQAHDVTAGLSVSSKDVLEALDDYCAREHVTDKTKFETRQAIELFIKINGLTALSQINDSTIHKTYGWLKADGRNPGGQQFVLRRVRAFLRYCVGKKWLMADPFPYGFEMPASDHEATPLSEKDFDRLTEVRIDSRRILDILLRHSLIIGRYSMARPSTVWGLTPESFRYDGTEMLVPAIKKQDRVWVPVHPEALESVRAMLAITPPGRRLFGRWASVQGIHDAVRDKCEDLTKSGYPLKTSFHQACKVTQVTALDNLGLSIGKISQVSNTTKETLLKHYVKTDRAEAFDAYHGTAIRQTTPRPQDGWNTGDERVFRDLAGPSGNVENVA